MYSGLRDQRRWILPEVLAEQARSQPDCCWIETTDGDTLTFGQADADVSRMAGFLAGSGVKPGDMVAVFLPNSLDFVRVWLGLGRLGAVAVLLNTELTGGFLRHQLETCGARLAVLDRARLEALRAIAGDLNHLRRVLVVDAEAPPDVKPFEAIAWQAWKAGAVYDGRSPLPQDIACVMYTSGTSGPAKGVLMPHAHCYLYGLGTIDALQLAREDRYYIVLPLFHANGLLMQLGAALIAGIPAVVRARFSASAWLDDVRKHRATVTNTLGAIAAFIVGQAPSAADRDHQLRAMLNVPSIAEHEATFRERFGVRDILSAFGMTEVNIPVWGRLGHSRPGTAGWVHDQHFEVVIADPGTDGTVPSGELGEILVRPKVPFGFMAGYHAMPDRTVEAWRNLWFHTGDAGLMDETGLVTFVDRIKDCIRRRGENISASEVEAALMQLPGIAEVAAFAVPSSVRGGEDELMLAVVAAPGAGLTPKAIADHASRVLPRFARPRFIELVSELPKTATGKVQRAQLRKRGVGPASWDSERAIQLT
jgi:crotonobetaine/carnitine-CoA ligase